MVQRRKSSWARLVDGCIYRGDAELPINLYRRMQENSSVCPPERNLVALLKACSKHRDLKTGTLIHAEATKSRLLGKNLYVGTALVDMYARCGFLCKAHDVFDELHIRDVVTWNTLILGYGDHGYGFKALLCFQHMQAEGLIPNTITYVCVLKACSSIRAVDMGQKIHADIERNGLLQDNLFIGNSLINMYAKCGLLSKCREVYDTLRVQDVISYNTMIAGYADHGLGEEALEFFTQMQLENISPNVVTYIVTLKSCAVIGAEEKGQEIHAELARQGLLMKNLVIGNALVDMYANCGSLAKAQETFTNLIEWDIVSCNILMNGYVESGFADEALECLHQLQREGLMPDIVTYICTLKACTMMQEIFQGKEIHSEVIKKGLIGTDIGLGNTLLDMYAKCGFLHDARRIFDSLQTRDEIAWNMLMEGYADYGHSKEVFTCLKAMKLSGVLPSAVTFVNVLKACGDMKDTAKGDEIHADIVRLGLLQTDSFLGSALVDMHMKQGSTKRAQEIFDKLAVRDIVTWNTLMAGYIEHEQGRDALQCFERMRFEATPPDAVTLILGLIACASVGAREIGRLLHSAITKAGMTERGNIGNAVIDMYAKCGLLMESAKVIHDLGSKDVVSWNALIAGYAEAGESGSVFDAFGRMRGEGINPDAVTLISVFKACIHAGLYDEGLILYENMSKVYGIALSAEHHNCIVDLLGCAGELDKAVSMIEKIPSHPDLVVWDSVLNACRRWGNPHLGRKAFENVVRSDPHDAGPYVLMCYIYMDAGMQVEASEIEEMRPKKAEPGNANGGVTSQSQASDACVAEERCGEIRFDSIRFDALNMPTRPSESFMSR